MLICIFLTVFRMGSMVGVLWVQHKGCYMVGWLYSSNRYDDSGVFVLQNMKSGVNLNLKISTRMPLTILNTAKLNWRLL